MARDYFIPRWAYYISLVIFVLGILQMLSGNLKWDASLEGNIAIGITITCLIIVLINEVGGPIYRARQLK